MSSEVSDITVFVFEYFKKMAESKGMTLKEYVEKLEADIKKVMGEDHEKMQRL
jgi:hypothetical protein